MKNPNGYQLLKSDSFFKQLSLTIIFNSAIAGLIYVIFSGNQFLRNFFASQIIGLSIFSSIHIFYYIRYRLTQQSEMILSLTLVALTLGALAGLAILYLLTAMYLGVDVVQSVKKNYLEIIQNLFFSLAFGAIIINYFISRVKIAKAETELQKHKVTLLDNEKRMLESNLRRLQSQIEPHFLFNTLSNVIGLIDKSPARSKVLLESLTHYLRATLEYTRQETATLEDELNMIEAYLSIYKERMGDRLQYKISVPEEIYVMPFPPMLMQPLVENAIIHGLESQIDGGYINIFGVHNKDKVRLHVEDSGVGLVDEVGNGVGLANVQQRLHALYGHNACLVLEDNKPNGLRAIIEVPNGSV